MNRYDSLWNEIDNIYMSWGLKEIPFSESASNLVNSRLHEVFTGRENELRKVINLFKGQGRKSLFVYGWMGIGKSAFIFETLDILRHNRKDILSSYISLPPETDLATAALVALAREMTDDPWAQHLLNIMGLPTERVVVEKETKISAGISSTGVETKEKTIDLFYPKIPNLSFDDLLKRALKKYNHIVIAIDDLDKQDPARVRELLRDNQGLMKGGASFILTGHPYGLTRDILTRDMGLFDLAIELQPLNHETTYLMLVNYLNSARIDSKPRLPENPMAVRPFTLETAHILCEHSNGVPRWLNRLGNYILSKAIELRADTITMDVLEQGLAFADQELRGQTSLTPEDYYVLDLLLEKGTLSDATITLTDLERVRAKEFNEILPILERLVQLDLIRRLPSDRFTEYSPTPMLSSKQFGDKNVKSSRKESE